MDRIALDLSSTELEAQRLATLKALQILDTPPEQEFDTVVVTVQKIFRCKIALISLVDANRQWFKAKCGLDVDETPRELAFCARAVEADDALIVEDASRDARFSDNPLVTGEPHIRFYAGIPIRAKSTLIDGRALPVGTLCVVDDKPRRANANDIEILKQLARLVESLMAARSAAFSAARLAEDRRLTLDSLRRSQRQFRQAERMANIGSWRLTLADRKTEWSEQTYSIHGLPIADAYPLEGALDFYPPHARGLVADAVHRAIETGEPFDLETDFTTAQGETRRVRSIGETELRDGAPIALIGVVQDVTDRYEMEQQLRQTAYTDDLTGLANRALFKDEFERHFELAASLATPLALLMIDLDHFKAINDQFGHPVGDELLKTVARNLQSGYLNQSLAARLGGDELVLLISCPHLLSDLPGLLSRLLNDLKHTVGEQGSVMDISATIGACRFSGDIHDCADLLRNADAALYQAKRQQRGSALIHGETILIKAPRSRPAPDLRIVSGDRASR